MKKKTPLLIALVIVFILVFYPVTYTVRLKERSLLLTFGKITRQDDEAGLKWKYPWQQVIKFDGRIRTLHHTPAEIQTRERQNLIVSVFVNWKISDARAFFESFGLETTNNVEVVSAAEKRMKGWIAEAANIFAEYELGQLITRDESKFMLSRLEDDRTIEGGGILSRLREKAGIGSGVEIVDVGVARMGVPNEVSEKVFERMREDRNAEVRRLLSEGQRQADSLIGDAQSQATIIKAEARAKAKEIMAEGDAKAAEQYATFRLNPELAVFLRKLETLQNTLTERTTIILDGNSPPYEMLKDGPEVKRQVGRGTWDEAH